VISIPNPKPYTLNPRGKLAESAQELTERSYNRAHVVLLVIDATRVQENGGMTRRELALATNVVGEGRALLVALNKLDALEDLVRLEVQMLFSLVAYAWAVRMLLCGLLVRAMCRNLDHNSESWCDVNLVFVTSGFGEPFSLLSSTTLGLSCTPPPPPNPTLMDLSEQLQFCQRVSPQASAGLLWKCMKLRCCNLL